MASKTALRRTQLVAGSIVAFAMGASSIHCGSSSDTSGGNGASGAGAGNGTGAGTGTGNATGTGGTIGDFDSGLADYSADQFFEDDPPPTTCDGGGQPPKPGGTPECPDDKNLPGCTCPQQGQTATCWTGKRKNRHHGICKDGQTTCQFDNENNLVWGPCVGEVLPKDNPATAKEACLCFSGGHWDVDNTSPCFFFSGPNYTGLQAAVSTTWSGTAAACPADANAPPAQPWSPNRLKTDCSGYFKLCYALRAGDGANPQPNDCELVKVCTESYYAPADTVVEFPPLPSWLADTPAQVSCAQAFVTTGGYGEMSVVGESDECDKVDKVFQHFTYCPLSCNDPNPPPECANCQPGGGGNF